MPINFYMVVHIPRAITLGLRMKIVDVLIAQEDEADKLPDPELLDRATFHKRILFSFDDDLLVESVERQRAGKKFGGVIFAHPLRISIGKCVQDLKMIAEVCELEDFKNHIEFLPL